MCENLLKWIKRRKPPYKHNNIKQTKQDDKLNEILFKAFKVFKILINSWLLDKKKEVLKPLLFIICLVIKSYYIVSFFSDN